MNERIYPEELKKLPRWNVWKLEKTSGKDGKEKSLKIPYIARSSKCRASTNKTGDWGTFDAAEKTFQSGGFNGLGLLMVRSDHLVFIDLDHCLNNNGKLKDADSAAADILHRIPGKAAYMERSQSGTGLHIILRGNLPGNRINNRDIGVEMYDNTQFCALTGNCVDSSRFLNIGDTVDPKMQEVITDLYWKYKPKGKTATAPRMAATSAPQTQMVRLSEEEVLDHCLRNEKFRDVYNGSWKRYSFPSQSEADLYLCGQLAFWTDRDYNAILSIVSKSTLFNKKWERPGYQRLTINKAIENCTESYSEWRARIQTEDFQRVTEMDPEKHPEDYPQNDIGMSRLFSDLYKNRVRYNATAKSWFAYNGSCWTKDEGGMEAEALSKLFAEAMAGYALQKLDAVKKDAPPEGTDPKSPEALESKKKVAAAKGYLNFVRHYGDRPRRKQMLEDARSYNSFTTEELDANKNLLNCANCVLNLETGEVLEHNPDFLFSKQTRAVYDPSAPTQEWEKFLSDIMEGNRNKTDYLQMIMGNSLSTNTSMEECYIFFGRTTRNGKSTLVETFGYALGDYATNMQPESLIQRNRDSRSPSSDIARLRGCRFAHCSEPPKSATLDAALLKSLTGGDKQTARKLNECESEFYIDCKFFIVTNYLLQTNDLSLFLSDRVRVITFDRHFSTEEQDVTMKERFQEARFLSGVLNWGYEGYKRFKEQTAKNGRLIPPEEVLSATREYYEDCDKIGQWIKDYLVPCDGSNISSAEFYQSYTGYARTNGYYPVGKNTLFQELRARNLLSNTGMVNGKQQRNVIRGCKLFMPMTGYTPFDGPGSD